MEQPEKVWIAQYRRGNAEALGLLVEHYRRPLFGFILKMTEGRGDANEIFQEVWFRAIRHLNSYRQKNFLGWLFRIAHNLIIDEARKQKPMVSMQDEKGEEGHTLEDRLEATDPGPDAESGARELGQRIMEEASKLPPEQREVFLMRTQGDLPFKEIARIQGVSINTALARMQYALSKLREALKSEYEELKAF